MRSRAIALWATVVVLVVPGLARAQAAIEEVPATVDEVVRQTGAHEGTWIPVAGIAIWLIVQIVKQPSIPIPLPPYARPLIAVVLGQLYGLVAEGIFNKQTWMVAIMRGAIAAGGAIAVHEFGSAAATAVKKVPPTGGATTLVLLALFGLGGLSSCAAHDKLVETLHDVEDLNDTQTSIATEAKPCFEAEANRDEAACKEEPACIAKVHATANRRADLLDAAHAKQCKLNPLLEGCTAGKVPQ
jgi:hypothetical protein